MDLDGASNSLLSPQLPHALQLHVLSFLAPNDRALSGRLVSPDAADALTGPDHCTASVSQPLPPHAVPWAVETGQQHVRQLPFRHKLQLLCTAAASGSEVNLEVAWALLQPSVLPELLQKRHEWWYEAYVCRHGDPGVAAVKAGHPELLGWLLRDCSALVDRGGVLAAAARYCDLQGLQTAWGLLQPTGVSDGGSARRLLHQQRDAAAESATPDAVAKMEWIITEGAGAGWHLQWSMAAAAARSGDLGRLRWLRDRGCPVGGMRVLECALQHADLAVVQWLVDEAGCELPAVDSNWKWHVLLREAAWSQDAVAKLQWLRERGAPPLHAAAGDDFLAELAGSVVAAGRVDVLQHLRSLPGLTPEQDQRLLQAAFASPVKDTPMLEYLRWAGMELTPAAYSRAAGRLDTVRWFARQVSSRPSTEHLTRLIVVWPWDAPTHSRDLLQAVQLLVGQVGCTDWVVQQWQTEQLVCAAARRGDLALVQYLLQQLPGYRPGREVLAAAAEGGCEALLEWLVEQHPGCLAGRWGEQAYIAPAKNGDRGTLAALRRLGMPWGADDVVVWAVRWGCPVPGLRWLVEQGAPVGGARAMEDAVAGSRSHLSAEEGAWLRDLAETNRAN